MKSTEVRRQGASDLAQVDLARGAVHLEKLALEEIVVVDDVRVVLQDELIVALLADRLQGLACNHHISLPAWATQSEPARLRSGYGGSEQHEEDHSRAGHDEAGVGDGDGHGWCGKICTAQVTDRQNLTRYARSERSIGTCGIRSSVQPVQRS